MNTVIMPKELTAENGAKGLLMGEFSENVAIQCPSCDGSGSIEMGAYDPDEVCDECEGAGEYTLKVAVSWSKIKEIYAMAVKHLGNGQNP